jgi:hypothetical protein
VFRPCVAGLTEQERLRLTVGAHSVDCTVQALIDAVDEEGQRAQVGRPGSTYINRASKMGLQQAIHPSPSFSSILRAVAAHDDPHSYNVSTLQVARFSLSRPVCAEVGSKFAFSRLDKTAHWRLAGYAQIVHDPFLASFSAAMDSHALHQVRRFCQSKFVHKLV